MSTPFEVNNFANFICKEPLFGQFWHRLARIRRMRSMVWGEQVPERAVESWSKEAQGVEGWRRVFITCDIEGRPLQAVLQPTLPPRSRYFFFMVYGEGRRPWQKQKPGKARAAPGRPWPFSTLQGGSYGNEYPPLPTPLVVKFPFHHQPTTLYHFCHTRVFPSQSYFTWYSDPYTPLPRRPNTIFLDSQRAILWPGRLSVVLFSEIRQGTRKCTTSQRTQVQ